MRDKGEESSGSVLHPREAELWDRVDRRLEELGWNRADLHRATQSGRLAASWDGRLSESRISKYRSGTGRLTVAHLVGLCEALDLTLDALALGGSAPPPRTAEEQVLCDMVFRGERPIGLAAAVRYIVGGVREDAEKAAPGQPPPAPGPRPGRPGPIQVKRGRPAGGGKGK